MNATGVYAFLDDHRLLPIYVIPRLHFKIKYFIPRRQSDISYFFDVIRTTGYSWKHKVPSPYGNGPEWLRCILNIYRIK